ncbi:MAG: DMT family transporter [Opitutaceae bacterium]|nr:DMT family transporter [Opitutaceae bacterium]
MNPVSTSFDQTRHRHGILLMVFSTFCFAANALMIRALGTVQAVDVWFLASIRFITGLGLILLLYRTGPDGFQPRHLYRRPRLIARGIVGALGVYIYYLTIVKLGAGRAAFINNTYVIMGALLAVLMLGERFRRSVALGGFFALTGLALLTNAFGTGVGISFYDWIAIVGALGSAYVIVTIRQLHAEGEHTSTIFGAQCSYGLLLCLGPALFNWSAPDAIVWLLIVASAFCSGAGQISMTRAFRDLPVGEGSLLQMLVPLGIAVGGVILFGEQHTATELLGAALILGGTAWPTVRR